MARYGTTKLASTQKEKNGWPPLAHTKAFRRWFGQCPVVWHRHLALPPHIFFSIAVCCVNLPSFVKARQSWRPALAENGSSGISGTKGGKAWVVASGSCGEATKDGTSWTKFAISFLALPLAQMEVLKIKTPRCSSKRKIQNNLEVRSLTGTKNRKERKPPGRHTRMVRNGRIIPLILEKVSSSWKISKTPSWKEMWVQSVQHLRYPR